MRKVFSFLPIFFLAVYSSFAQEEQGSAEDLAKKLANPIASLISVPFQNNFDYGIGDFRGSKNVLNIQPVIPISITPKLNMITRIIVPIVSQYNINGYGTHESGLSDMVVSAFFSPKESKNGFTWGVGPVFLFPTGTETFLSGRKWGIGPTFVGLKQTGGWTIGVLANQIWSYAGDDDRSDVNQMFVNPFVGYNWKSGAGATAVIEWTQNWEANNGTLYIIPTFSGLTSFGKQKVSFAVGPRFNIAAPDAAESKFGIRAAAVLLFPK